MEEKIKRSKGWGQMGRDWDYGRCEGGEVSIKVKSGEEEGADVH